MVRVNLHVFCLNRPKKKTATQSQGWKNYQRLEYDLKLFVSQILKQVEILDYMKRDFGDYNRSLVTLTRRLKELGITYTIHETNVGDVKAKGNSWTWKTCWITKKWIKTWQQSILFTNLVTLCLMLTHKALQPESKAIKLRRRNNRLPRRDHCGFYLLTVMINFVVIKIRPFSSGFMVALMLFPVKYFSFPPTFQTFSPWFSKRNI